MENEQMKDIENYEGLYQISSFGKVFSVKRQKFLKPRKNNKGYLSISLCKDGKAKNCLVHRLVAQAFIENPLHLPIINHKDENPLNNRVENLEYCDYSYNNTYGTRTERMLQHPNYKASREKCGNPIKLVLQFTKQGEFVAEYPSAHEASRKTKIAQSNISQCCLGKRYKSCGGFVWRFKEEVASYASSSFSYINVNIEYLNMLNIK